MEQGTGQRPDSICSLTYLVNEGQLNKQLNSHREGKVERGGSESRGEGGKETRGKVHFPVF